ncbi:MAG: glycosyltransferase [Saprospiraceae bacterium]
MKKIVLLSPAHPLRGGIAAFSDRFALELQRAGYEVIIYTFSLQYPGFLFPGTSQYSDDPPPEGLDIRIKVNSVNPLNWLKVGLELRRLRPDVVVPRYWLPFMGPCLGTILRIAKSNGHTKVVALADNILPHEKRPGDRLFTRYFIGAVDACITMSRSVEEDLRQFNATMPAACIPHPVYDNYGEKATRATGLAHLGLPEAVRYVLFFGFIRDYKGLDLLLKAMAGERLRQMNVKLIVAGEYYGNREFYENLIRELNLEDRVILRTDYIPSEEVKYYFAAADLVAQPYKSATQSGISQMAYHFEKPMLVTNVGGLPEIVPHGEAGYVVAVEVDAIADALIDFFQNDKAAAFTKGVVAGKRRFSWPGMVEGVEGLYKKIQDR